LYVGFLLVIAHELCIRIMKAKSRAALEIFFIITNIIIDSYKNILQSCKKIS